MSSTEIPLNDNSYELNKLDSNDFSNYSLSNSQSQSQSHIININEEKDTNSKTHSVSPQLKISISRSSSGSYAKIPSPLTQIAYEAINIKGLNEKEAPVKEKKNQKSNKSKKKNKGHEKGEKRNGTENINDSNEYINISKYRSQSPTKFARVDTDLEFSELNERNSLVDGMIDMVETSTSSIQSYSNIRTSNTSLIPNNISKSKHNRSNVSSKTKLNSTSKSSSKLAQSSKLRKSKNKLNSKLLKQKTLSSSNQAEDYINEVKGLSSEEALNRLLIEEEKIIENEYSKKRIFKNKAYIITTILQFITLIIFVFLFITSTIKQKSINYSVEFLIESILLLFWMIFNFIIVKHESKAYSLELVNKAKYVFNKIRTSGINMIQELRIPSTYSVSVLRVIRDGKSKTFPVPLLVKGDIVEITYGEGIPCDAEYVPSERNKTYIPKTPILKKRQKFRPNFFEPQVVQDGLQETTFNSSLFTFELLETPIHDSFESIFKSKRPLSPIDHYKIIFSDEISKHFIIYNLIIAIAIGLGRFLYEIFANNLKENITNVGIDLLLYRPLSSLIPIIFNPFIIGYTLVHVFGNSHILFMFEQLKKSKNEYKDDENIDEFDPAPAPTKDIHVSLGDALKYSQSIFKTKKGTLLRSSSLLDTLGSITVICALDKEGTLSYPFPSIEQLFFIDREGKSVILDVEENAQNPNGIRFEDNDWKNHLSSLKPLGLNLLLNTNCGFAEGKIRNDPHRRLSGLHFCGRTQSARQSNY